MAGGREQRELWSPDGTEIAFVSGRDGEDDLYLLDADGGPQRRVSRAGDEPSGDQIWDVAWSPDGSRVLIRTVSNAFVWNRASNRTREVPGELRVQGAGWSPDSKRICTVNS